MKPSLASFFVKEFAATSFAKASECEAKKNLSRFCMSGANLQNRGSTISNKIEDFDEIGKIVASLREAKTAKEPVKILASPKLQRSAGRLELHFNFGKRKFFHKNFLKESH